MSLTYGFYNSNNGDRVYDATQMSSIFDGIIEDGVFEAINDGTHLGFQVIPVNPANMTVVICKGRAWFNHTWTLNDSQVSITIPAAEVATNRYDAVVLEVNSGTRTNSFKVISGTPGESPVKPTPTNNDIVHQHVLAYIYVAKNATSIASTNITNNIGTSSCPWVTGPLTVVDATTLYQKWEEQWSAWSSSEQGTIQSEFSKWKEEWEAYYSGLTSEMSQSKETYNTQWNDWFTSYKNSNVESMSAWTTEQQTAFTEWFNGLQDTLSDDVAAKLAQQIVELQKRATSLEAFDTVLTGTHSIVQDIYDTLSDSTALQDSSGRTIESQLIFVVK